jgi:hypothetical protein
MEDPSSDTYGCPTVYHDGKLYGTLIEPSSMTREQLLKVLDSAQCHIVQLHDGEYDLMDDNKLHEFRD